jgi:hypothetical protein
MQTGDDANGHGRHNTERSPDESCDQHRPRSGVVSAQDYACIHQPKEEQHDLHRDVPSMFGVMNRAIVVRRR